MKISGHIAAYALCLGCLNAAEERPAFKSLRYDEGYSFLADPARRTEWLDSLKYFPIANGRAGYLSIGGEIRERFETYENEFFRTDSDADSAYLLQRYLLHVDYHATEWLRVFGQFQSSLEDGRPAGPRPTDEDTIDLHQLFLDLAWQPVTFRFGRQEMAYGSERLISVREGPNNRRSFDAARILYRHLSFSIDAFFSSPVEVDPGAFDDQNIDDVWFWGAYATLPVTDAAANASSQATPRSVKIDIYYLGLREPGAEFGQDTGDEERHTLGTRFFGKLGRWDMNHEAMYQFGRFGSGDINAWSVATDHGYTLDDLWSKPRLGLKAAIASGDRDPVDADLQTFNPLFPRGTYFTEASLLGPQNFFDIHPSLRLKPAPQWTVDLGADFYWRQSRDDGIYTPGGSVIYPGNSGFARFVGTDLSLLVSWQPTRHLTVSTAYTHFFPGQFIRQNKGTDVNFAALWVTLSF